MENNFFVKIKTLGKGKIFLLAFLAYFIFQVFMMISVSSLLSGIAREYISDSVGLSAANNLKGVKPLDMYFYYNCDTAYNVLAAFKETGRNAYFNFVLVDMVYPLVYGFFLLTGIMYVFSNKLKKDMLAKILTIASIFGVLMDYAENTCVIIMLKSFPAKLAAIGTLGGIFTLLKWIFVMLPAILIIIGLIIILFKKLLRLSAD